MPIQFETVNFTSGDGFRANLQHVVHERETPRGPVMLVHGAGVRANIFNPPTKRNLVQMLVDDGYDVWLENWRASIDFPPNEWNLDQAALYDHPAAVKKVLEQTGTQSLKAIIHCQGSTSFMISYMLGLVPEVSLIISNAVSLHPVVPSFSVFKLKVFVPIVKLLFTYLNPQWGLEAPDLKTKVLRMLVNLSHREKDTLVGKFVSFTYGAGFPALWRLENLDEVTKNWIQHEFAEVPLSFFDHINKAVSRGQLLAADAGKAEASYVDRPLPDTARIVLFAGERNLCFLPQSQQNTYAYLEKQQPKKHKIYSLKDYSHLDVFFGKNAHRDVFPIMLKELNQTLQPKTTEPCPYPEESSDTGTATHL